MNFVLARLRDDECRIVAVIRSRLFVDIRSGFDSGSLYAAVQTELKLRIFPAAFTAERSGVFNKVLQIDCRFRFLSCNLKHRRIFCLYDKLVVLCHLNIDRIDVKAVC